LTERIFIGAQYGIVDWLRDGYAEMVRRPTLTIEDLRGPPFPVTWETAAKLFHSRERLLSSNSDHNCGTCYERNYFDPPNPRDCRSYTTAIVDEVFKADFEAMKGNPISSGPPLPTSKFNCSGIH
jgi:hypothetical protein